MTTLHKKNRLPFKRMFQGRLTKSNYKLKLTLPLQHIQGKLHVKVSCYLHILSFLVRVNVRKGLKAKGQYLCKPFILRAQF